MSISLLNSFCRRYDLVFAELGTKQGEEVYWFIDFENNRRYYTNREIRSKMNL